MVVHVGHCIDNVDMPTLLFWPRKSFTARKIADHR